MFADIGGVPAVLQSTGRDHDNKDMGYWWIFALVIIFFALIFWRRDGNDGRSPLADVAALNALNGGNASNTNAEFTKLNGRFDALSQQVSHVNDVNDLRDLKSTQAAIMQNITQQSFNLSTQVATNRTDTLLNFKDLALQNANCCCDIKSAIDSVNFNAAQNTCNIINNDNANTQRILDRLATDEITRLRDEVSKERLALSQARQDIFIERQSDRVIGALTPPCPVPSYPAWPTNQPINPYAYGGIAGGGPYVKQVFTEAAV